MRTVLALCLAAMPLVPARAAGPGARALAWSILPPCSRLPQRTASCHRVRAPFAPTLRPSGAWGIRTASTGLRAATAVGSPEWEEEQRERSLVSTGWLAENLEDVTLLDVRGVRAS